MKVPPIPIHIDLRSLPDGDPDPARNSTNALHFRADHIDDPDKEYVDQMSTGILEGLFVYLGGKRLQLTKLGYLFLEAKGKMQ